VGFARAHHSWEDGHRPSAGESLIPMFKRLRNPGKFVAKDGWSKRNLDGFDWGTGVLAFDLAEVLENLAEYGISRQKMMPQDESNYSTLSPNCSPIHPNSRKVLKTFYLLFPLVNWSVRSSRSRPFRRTSSYIENRYSNAMIILECVSSFS